jgi:hypothetical protein
MGKSWNKKASDALKIAVAFLPWLISMYLLYWLGESEIWAPDTAHRDKITIAVVAVGMALSFLLHSRLYLRANK